MSILKLQVAFDCMDFQCTCSAWHARKTSTTSRASKFTSSNGWFTLSDYDIVKICPNMVLFTWTVRKHDVTVTWRHYHSHKYDLSVWIAIRYIYVFCVRITFPRKQAGSFTSQKEIESQKKTQIRTNFRNKKSCCVLSKWSFINRQITSCKLADYSKAVDYKL